MAVIAESDFIAQLSDAFAPIPSVPVLMHVDLARLGVIVGPLGSRNEMLGRFWRCLCEAASPRPIILPTFNYDFCHTGVYEPRTDPCQVGVLNEYVRRCYPERRTLTPIFNFVSTSSFFPAKGPARNVFGADSNFGELHRLDGTVVFLGASFSSNTFMHFVEEEAAVGYRYPKRFAGTLRLPEGSSPVVVTYRVRPRGTRMGYDHCRLEKECLRRGILRRARVGNSYLLWFRMSELRDYYLEALRRDEFHLLDAEGKAEAQALYRKWGRPLRLEDFEQR